MDNFKKLYQKELANLEIGNENEITKKLVVLKFKRKALKVHSDKTGKDDEEFKDLLRDYNTLIVVIDECTEEGEFVEKCDLQNFFERHNFAKEFSKTWTIFIEKDKTNKWKNMMEKRYPGGKSLQGNGTQYQTPMNEGTVYTTLYDVLVPKLNIQGKHIYLRKFVMEILPDVYKDVCGDVPSIEMEKLAINARVRLSGETIFTCDICEKKYVRKTAMKKHMQTKHGQNKVLGVVQQQMTTTSPKQLDF